MRRGLEEAVPTMGGAAGSGFGSWSWDLRVPGACWKGVPRTGGFGSPTLGSSCVSRKGVTEQVTRRPCPPGWKGPCSEHHMADKRPVGRTSGISQGRQPSWENHTWVLCQEEK